MTFRPIAIVGQACVLPGAATPDALWDAVISRRDLLTPVSPERWRMDGDLVVAADPSDTRDHIISNRAGVVADFAFSPDGLRLPADVLAPLDPLCHWLLHTGREALRTARVGREERGGAIFGNLSFPSDGLSCFAESVWCQNSGLTPIGGAVARENRFMSGLPAHILANALGLDAGVLALDAACASSLYAMQVACSWLSTGRADVMLAGGVNRAEMLFLQMGFTALTALSPTGRSRPFHREADGLVPAEGAALIALRRLDDAVRRKDTILGVIRGIGLSNDGRSEGVLIPASDGQVRAMRRAYEVAGLSPADISLVECHAPGTHIGDGIEVASLSRVFEGCSGVGIGSVKSNLGHLITAAGAAGVIKVLAAMKAETLPPTLHADDPLANIEGSPLRLLHDAEPWKAAGLRRAAVSGFGFGGNNSHVIVEEWREQRISFPAAGVATPPPDLAIVGIGAVVASTTGLADFTRALIDGESRLGAAADGSLRGAANDVVLPLKGLRFPPRDLEQTLPQQLAVLQAALEAVGPLGDLPHDRTCVLVGMQTDAEIARYGMRWRLESWCRAWIAAGAGTPDAGWLANARQDVVSPLQAAGVIGTMPNIPANRINRQLDLRGPSYTVSAEELSGIRALEIAAQALHDRDVDVAIVGAVDLSCEEVQIAAMPDVTPGDAAVVLVIKRLEQARRDGDRVYAVLPAVDHGRDATLTFEAGARGANSALTSQFGHAHACSGLLHVAAAALACHHRMVPDAPSPARPWLATPDGRIAEVRVGALGGQHATVMLQTDPASPSTIPSGLPNPTLVVYSGRDRADVIAAIDARRSGNLGPARLVLVADAADQIEPLQSSAREALRSGSPLPSGAYFHERPITGELAFVFSGPGGAYHGMGRDLLLAAPELVDGLSSLITRHREAAGWLYRPDSVPTPTDKLWGSSYLTQVHAQLTRKILGLRPTAAIGFCSGETNALFAMGAWSDMDAFHQRVTDSGIFTREIGGEHLTVRRAWQEKDPIRWTSWQVLAPESSLRDLLAGEPRVHLAIINAPGNFVISGDADGCDRVLATLGTQRARPLNYDLCTHCPETSAFFDEWRALHHRPTAPVPGVRFYTHSTIDSYQPTDDSAADALVGQFSHTVDFPRLIQKAWDDGVRVFVEHGPVGSCSRWIDQILGDREHVAIPLDIATRSSWNQVWHAIGRLVAAGVEMPGLDGWIARARQDTLPAAASDHVSNEGPMLRLPAHPPAIRLAPLPVPNRNQTSIVPAVVRQVVVPSTAAPVGQSMAAPPSSPLAITIRPGVAVAASLSHTSIAVNEPEALQTLEVSDLHGQFLRTIQQMGQVHQQYVDAAEGAYRSLLSSWPASQHVLERDLSMWVEAPLPAVDDEAHTQNENSEAAVDSSAEAQQTPRDRDVARLSPVAPLPGPKFSRAQLEWLASREVSAVLGDLFKRQDGFARQVRMPEPPLLLADRVTGIDATPGVLGEGTIWTETDVAEDAWYVHAGHMTPGVMIEAGQADLLLVSWMGADFLNQGRRVYRLLGCELTFHGRLAHIGDTCAYDIHIDGHADHGDVRIFFFHSDCRISDDIRLSVRHGQAGFFTDEELASSAGVLWDPAAITLPPGRVDPPLVPTVRSSFTAAEVRAFSEGRAFECFGPGYELAQTHTRTPTISAGRMQLFDEVTHLDLTGGPWGRGYLRAEQHLHPDDWFLKGHFKNDPCMPGTLMFDGCMQAMAFYLAALGTTIEHDAWRFEPVSGERFTLRCRGQATPASRLVVYEVFVREVITGP
ncbi:MAG TPA: beta-ketoacyl synthase N-terminal-like domain-containing protein, partial [Vicinamibacterales bacterium]